MLAACGFQVNASGPNADAPPMIDAPPPVEAWLAGFGHRKPIDLAGRPTQLDDFVASIAQASDPDLVGSATVAFTAADGTTLLPTEVVVFDAGTGKLEAWVTTTLAANTTTRIYLYYGDGIAPPAALPWAAARHAGVWHMDGAGTNNNTTNDSKLVHHATANPTEIPAMAEGIVGAARSYDGLNDLMSIPDPPDGSLDVGIRSFTVDLWVNVTVAAGSFDMPFYKGGLTASVPGYDIELGGGTWFAGFSDGASGQLIATFGAQDDLLGAWRHLVAVCDRSTNTIRTYVDGAPVAVVGFTRGSFDSASPLQFGHSTYEFRGLLDEVRLYTEALSADWIAAEHENIAKRASFVMIGAAEPRP
jgi:hypothetical protein